MGQWWVSGWCYGPGEHPELAAEFTWTHKIGLISRLPRHFHVTKPAISTWPSLADLLVCGAWAIVNALDGPPCLVVSWSCFHMLPDPLI